MGKKIIYSLKEYEEEYPVLLDSYFLEYKEVEEIDFINSEIENYDICLQIVNLPIEQVFNRWFRIETGTNLKVFSISEKTFNIIFKDENEKYYYKIYSDFEKLPGEAEKKVKQSRLGFGKILNFLDQRKHVLEMKLKSETPRHEHIFCNNGFELFEDILSEYVKPTGKKGRLSDIHYYYWKMYEDDFIHQRPERFKTWFFETYEKEDLGKIKTLKEVENLDRKIHYATALDWFKQQHR